MSSPPGRGFLRGVTRTQLAWAVGFVAVLAVVPLFASKFLLAVLALIFLFAFVGHAWNLMTGYAGQLSLGHALYFGVGAYVVATFSQRFGLSPWLCLVPAFVVPAVLGALVGALGFRFSVRGTYFALLTIAFAEFVRILFEHWEFVGTTGGLFYKALGPDNRPLVSLRGDAVFVYYAHLVLLVLGWIAAARVVNSRIGYFWRAVREDEDAARALGVPAFRVKIVAVALSAGMTGLGGAWFGLMQGSLFPETVLGMRMSIELIVAPIVGGLGTLFGPILGAFITVPLNELARDLAQAEWAKDLAVRLGLHGIAGVHFLVYGALLGAIIVFAPAGIWPWIARRLGLDGRR
jgi:branched-chain amino acid transport system permease protein